MELIRIVQELVMVLVKLVALLPHVMEENVTKEMQTFADVMEENVGRGMQFSLL